jgi:hypothetical protein
VGASPAVDVVLAKFDRETAWAVRAGGLLGHEDDREPLIALRDRVLWAQVAFGELDQTEQRTRFLEVIGLDALHRRLPLYPRDRAQARAAVDSAMSKAVPDVVLITIQ